MGERARLPEGWVRRPTGYHRKADGALVVSDHGEGGGPPFIAYASDGLVLAHEFGPCQFGTVRKAIAAVEHVDPFPPEPRPG
jgi:hypothetical protein